MIAWALIERKLCAKVYAHNKVSHILKYFALAWKRKSTELNEMFVFKQLFEPQIVLKFTWMRGGLYLIGPEEEERLTTEGWGNNLRVVGGS